jgi:hypothetical protein
VFSKPEIKKLFQPYRLVQLYADEVPDQFYAPELRASFDGKKTRQTQDAVVNYDFQVNAFKTSQRPLYAIVRPRLDGKIDVVSKYEEGKINNVTAFAKFLTDPVSPGGGGIPVP